MNLRTVIESDVRFYLAIGVAMVLIYGLTIAVLARSASGRMLIALTVGFFIFMIVYSISISVQVLENSGR